MREFLTAAAVAALFAVGSSAAQTQSPLPASQAQAQTDLAQLRALPEASREALVVWLEHECGVGAREDHGAALRAIPGLTSGVLIEAYNRGPSPELERAHAAAFAQAYAARNAALAQEGALFDPADLERLRSVTREEYVARRLGQARLNYRTNAVRGLGVVGGEDALRVLNAIAADAQSPMRAAAQAAITDLRQRGQ
jgi:hypothetical protein